MFWVEIHCCSVMIKSLRDNYIAKVTQFITLIYVVRYKGVNGRLRVIPVITLESILEYKGIIF